MFLLLYVSIVVFVEAQILLYRVEGKVFNSVVLFKCRLNSKIMIFYCAVLLHQGWLHIITPGYTRNGTLYKICGYILLQTVRRRYNF